MPDATRIAVPGRDPSGYAEAMERFRRQFEEEHTPFKNPGLPTRDTTNDRDPFGKRARR